MPPKRRTVLCVDDDSDAQLLVLDTLREIDPSLRMASALNGAEALRFLEDAKKRKTLPRLVIMNADASLSGGEQALALIQADRDLAEVPVVLLGASLPGGCQSWALSAGVELLGKPLHPMELYKTIKHLLHYCIA